MTAPDLPARGSRGFAGPSILPAQTSHKETLFEVHLALWELLLGTENKAVAGGRLARSDSGMFRRVVVITALVTGFVAELAAVAVRKPANPQAMELPVPWFAIAGILVGSSAAWLSKDAPRFLIVWVAILTGAGMLGITAVMRNSGLVTNVSSTSAMMLLPAEALAGAIGGALGAYISLGKSAFAVGMRLAVVIVGIILVFVMSQLLIQSMP